MKYWQAELAESTKHWSIYNPSRSRTESYFSQLKSPSGGDFRMGRTEWKRGSLWSVAAAMAVVHTNLRFISAFATGQAMPASEPDDPTETVRSVDKNAA